MGTDVYPSTNLDARQPTRLAIEHQDRLIEHRKAHIHFHVHVYRIPGVSVGLYHDPCHNLYDRHNNYQLCWLSYHHSNDRGLYDRDLYRTHICVRQPFSELSWETR